MVFIRGYQKETAAEYVIQIIQMKNNNSLEMLFELLEFFFPKYFISSGFSWLDFFSIAFGEKTTSLAYRLDCIIEKAQNKI